MATISMNYANAASLTISLASLASGARRQSAMVDNATNKYVDALVGGSIQVGTSPTNNNAIEIYAYGTYNGTNYTANAGTADADFATTGNEANLRFLTSVVVNGTSDVDYKWGPVSVAQAFGGVLPPKWGIVVRNNTGAALNATGTNNGLSMIGVKYESA